jgi:class 3 adenylate cyclase/tetratricopeptide (TPR) repeat protein
MKCPRCQQENPPQAKFCLECATPLALRCTDCGTQLPSGAKFCFECAKPVGAPGSPSRFASPETYTPKHLAERIINSKAALEGERKQVTVVFCDIVGSTALAERLGADAMHELLSRFFELTLSEVHRYEGTVNQFLGDGFMALFGAPVAHEDHARRAVLAVLGVKEALRQNASGLGARVGINTGFVVVGAIGDNLRMDYTAIGDTTNVAARLQQLAEPGTILISEATRLAARGVAEVETLPPLTVKGKTEAIAAHRVIGVAPPRSSVDALAERELSPFVGRDEELATLQRLFAAASLGRGQVVGIVGEPGLGKSRLLLEFRRAAAIQSGQYIEGRCLSYGSTTPYLPLIDVVRVACGIGHGDTPETTGDKLRQTLAKLGIEAERAAPYLLHLLGIKKGAAAAAALNAETLRERIFTLLDEIMARSSGWRPLVLAIEDVHWIDRTSESYLASLAETLAGMPILLVATSRPGYHPPWVGKSYATQIALRPLSTDDNRVMLDSTLRRQQISDDVISRILEKAEGNPFFLEELVQAVVGRGGAAAIPGSVHDVLVARIDRLPEAAKRLLQTAAVIGRHVPPRLLAQVWEDPASLTGMLQELKRQEFVFDERRGDEAEVVFKHVLTQEVAYETIILPRRRSLHATVGRALERLYAGRLDEVVDRLALHYRRADDPAKAVFYLVRVAERAIRGFAHADALTALEEARTLAGSLTGDESDRAFVDIAVLEGEALHYLGRRAESVQRLSAERERLERTGDEGLSARYHYRLGFASSFLGNREAAATALGTALRAAQHCGDVTTAASTHALLAIEGWFAGDYRAGRAHAQEGVMLLLPTPARSALGTAYLYLSLNEHVLGRLGVACEAGERAEAIGRELGDRRLTCHAIAVYAWPLGWSRGWAAVIPRLEESLAMAPDAFEAALVHGQLGLALYHGGRVAEALARLEIAVNEADRYRSIQVRSWYRAFLAEAFVANGRAADAIALAAAALEMAESARHPWGISLAERVLGLAALARGDRDEARRRLSASQAAVPDHTTMQVLGHLALAELDAAGGDPRDAAVHLARARELAVESEANTLLVAIDRRI